jgi:hypothetical protein
MLASGFCPPIKVAAYGNSMPVIGTTESRPQTTNNIQHTTYNIQHTTYNIQQTTNNKQLTIRIERLCLVKFLFDKRVREFRRRNTS